MKKGKEINQVVYSNSQNVDYLPEEDLYIYKRQTSPYKLNVIGAGMIAQEHMRVTMLEGRATIHGIYARTAQSINRAKGMFAEHHPHIQLKEYQDLTSACMDPEVDGLIICTPNFTHMEIVREAIKSGKHIFLEKPMVTTLEDACAMRKLVAGYPSTFQLGLQYRYKAIYAQAIKEVLERRALGEVKTISIMEHRLPFLDKVSQWNKFSEYTGGTLVEKSCHYFDLFNLFAQSKPKQVYAVGGQDVNFVDFEYKGKKSDILDNAMVTVVYESGVKCNFNLCMFAPMVYEEITICGDKGRIRAYENENYLPEEGHLTHFEMLCADHGPSVISTPCYPKAIQNSGHMGSTYFAHRYFVDNMEGKATHTATVEDGFWSVIIGLAAEESVRTGAIVSIDNFMNKTGPFLR